MRSSRSAAFSAPPNSEVAEEFAATAAEMRITAVRDQAFDNLARRAGIASLRGIVSALNQSIRFGTPLAGSLRAVAAEMRTERLVRFEQRAFFARLPFKAHQGVVAIAPPFGISVLDLPTRIPLPAKITVEVLPAIDLQQRFGSDPAHKDIYEEITEDMQVALSELQDERTLPVLG